MLTVSVKNFGPIAEGSVDLKPLTIFVGPSNTGKSYMATAVYALAKAVGAFGHAGLPIGLQSIHSVAIRRRYLLREQLGRGEESREVVDSLREWAKQQTRKGSMISGWTVAALPTSVRLWLEKLTLQQIDSFHKDVVYQLHQMHGEESGFISRGIKPCDFRLSVHRSTPVLHLEVQLSDALKLVPEFDISQAAIPESAFELMPFFLNRDENDDDENWAGLEIASNLADSVSESAFAGLLSQCYYLPAARSGIAQGHKVLSAALVRQSRLIGLERLNIPTLPGITTEFLSYLISLDRRMVGRNRHPKLEDAISFIENEVLRGKIDLDELAGLPYPEIVYEPVGVEPSPGKFTLEHTSSMVSELAPLILFLKYLIGKDNLLILEEPESHLHPAAQRQLARGIVRLVNAGVKVLITTHSDTFVSQINNHLALSEASKELISERGFEEADFIRGDEIGAYLFRYNRELRGSGVIPLEIDPDTGIDEDEFAAVFEAQYDESIALQRDRN